MSWNDDDLLLDEETLQRREHARRQEEALVSRVRDVAASAPGRELFAAMFQRARLFQPLNCSEADIALHNDALHWLRVLARANPQAAVRIFMREVIEEEE